MRKEENPVEFLVAELLVRKFHQSRLAYENISLSSRGRIAVPDFNVQLEHRILLIETTAAPLLTIQKDPKETQRQIVREATSETNIYSWMFLYLQHCATYAGIALIIDSLDLLIDGKPSIDIQNTLDEYSLNTQNCPPFKKVDWYALRKEVFGYDNLPKITFWND